MAKNEQIAASPSDELLIWAKRAYALSKVHCRVCEDYHATWIYRRIAGVVGGLEAEGEQLASLCRDHIRSGAFRWLIVGSADIGQVDLLRRASGDQCESLDITLIDQCATPLRLCEDYAKFHSMKFESVQSDIRQIGHHPPFDAILLHSVLAFMQESEQVHVLSTLGTLLKPTGRMIIGSRIGSGERENPEHRFERNKTGLSRAIDHGLELPEDKMQFESRLRRLAEHHAEWDNTPQSEEALIRLIESAHLKIQNIDVSGHFARLSPFVGAGSKSRVIVTAMRSSR